MISRILAILKFNRWAIYLVVYIASYFIAYFIWSSTLDKYVLNSVSKIVAFVETVKIK